MPLFYDPFTQEYYETPDPEGPAIDEARPSEYLSQREGMFPNQLGQQLPPAPAPPPFSPSTVDANPYTQPSFTQAGSAPEPALSAQEGLSNPALDQFGQRVVEGVKDLGSGLYNLQPSSLLKTAMDGGRAPISYDPANETIFNKDIAFPGAVGAAAATTLAGLSDTGEFGQEIANAWNTLDRDGTYDYTGALWEKQRRLDGAEPTGAKAAMLDIIGGVANLTLDPLNLIPSGGAVKKTQAVDNTAKRIAAEAAKELVVANKLLSDKARVVRQYRDIIRSGIDDEVWSRYGPDTAREAFDEVALNTARKVADVIPLPRFWNDTKTTREPDTIDRLADGAASLMISAATKATQVLTRTDLTDWLGGRGLTSPDNRAFYAANAASGERRVLEMELGNWQDQLTNVGKQLDRVVPGLMDSYAGNDSLRSFFRGEGLSEVLEDGTRIIATGTTKVAEAAVGRLAHIAEHPEWYDFGQYDGQVKKWLSDYQKYSDTIYELGRNAKSAPKIIGSYIPHIQRTPDGKFQPIIVQDRAARGAREDSSYERFYNNFDEAINDEIDPNTIEWNFGQLWRHRTDEAISQSVRNTMDNILKDWVDEGFAKLVKDPPHVAAFRQAKAKVASSVNRTKAALTAQGRIKTFYDKALETEEKLADAMEIQLAKLADHGTTSKEAEAIGRKINSANKATDDWVENVTKLERLEKEGVHLRDIPTPAPDSPARTTAARLSKAYNDLAADSPGKAVSVDDLARSSGIPADEIHTILDDIQPRVAPEEVVPTPTSVVDETVPPVGNKTPPPPRESGLTGHEVTMASDSLRNMPKRSVSSANKAIEKLRAKGLDTSDVESALDDYKTLTRDDYDSADEFKEAKEEFWDLFLDTVDEQQDQLDELIAAADDAADEADELAGLADDVVDETPLPDAPPPRVSQLADIPLRIVDDPDVGRHVIFDQPYEYEVPTKPSYRPATPAEIEATKLKIELAEKRLRRTITNDIPESPTEVHNRKVDTAAEGLGGEVPTPARKGYRYERGEPDADGFRHFVEVPEKPEGVKATGQRARVEDAKVKAASAVERHNTLTKRLEEQRAKLETMSGRIRPPKVPDGYQDAGTLVARDGKSMFPEGSNIAIPVNTYAVLSQLAGAGYDKGVTQVVQNLAAMSTLRLSMDMGWLVTIQTPSIIMATGVDGIKGVGKGLYNVAVEPILHQQWLSSKLPFLDKFPQWTNFMDDAMGKRPALFDAAALPNNYKRGQAELDRSMGDVGSAASGLVDKAKLGAAADVVKNAFGKWEYGIYERFLNTVRINNVESIYDDLVHSGVPEARAAADAWDITNRDIPLMDYTREAISQRRQVSERAALFTSPSFFRSAVKTIDSVATGVTKLATFQPLTNPEKYAIKRTIHSLVSMTGLAGATATAYATATGEDLDTVLSETFNPASKNFLNMWVPDLVGSAQSSELRWRKRPITVEPEHIKLLKAMMPKTKPNGEVVSGLEGLMKWASNKQNINYKTIQEAMANKDWMGNDIVPKDTPAGAREAQQVLWGASRLVLPVAGVDALDEWGVSGDWQVALMTGIEGTLLGKDSAFESDRLTMERDLLARKEGWPSYHESPRSLQEKIDLDPKVQVRELRMQVRNDRDAAHGNDRAKFRKGNQMITNWSRIEQQNADVRLQDYWSGKRTDYTPTEWKKDWSEAGLAAANRREQLRQDYPEVVREFAVVDQTDPNWGIDQYYGLFTNPDVKDTNGNIDFDKLDAAQHELDKTLTPTQREFLADYLGQTGTPLRREYRETSAALRPYFDLGNEKALIASGNVDAQVFGAFETAIRSQRDLNPAEREAFISDMEESPAYRQYRSDIKDTKMMWLIQQMQTNPDFIKTAAKWYPNDPNIQLTALIIGGKDSKYATIFKNMAPELKRAMEAIRDAEQTKRPATAPLNITQIDQLEEDEEPENEDPD